jgi:ESCRT-II complex subunit VPS36
MQVAESFAAQFPDESLPFFLPTIPSSHAPPTSNAGSSAFHQTIARQIADFLLSPISTFRTSETFLSKQGGTITLPDLYAAFNRSRGIDLISPSDLQKATALFETLSLPVRIKKFRRSGAVVVRSADDDDEKIERRILGFVERVRKKEAGEANMCWGRGVTAAEVAKQFGWYLGVAVEQLEMCEDRGSLCREVGMEGVLFWENWFGKEKKELPGKSGVVEEVK